MFEILEWFGLRVMFWNGLEWFGVCEILQWFGVCEILEWLTFWSGLRTDRLGVDLLGTDGLGVNVFGD